MLEYLLLYARLPHTVWMIQALAQYAYHPTLDGLEAKHECALLWDAAFLAV